MRCVDIRNQKVLHINGDVLCFTSWQTAIEVTLVVSIIPVFLILALGPYSVKRKQMNTPLFIIACLLPLPVACYCLLAQLFKKITTQRRISVMKDGSDRGTGK